MSCVDADVTPQGGVTQELTTQVIDTPNMQNATVDLDQDNNSKNSI